VPPAQKVPIQASIPHGIGRNKQCVGKPFHYPELAARIGAVLRRSRGRRDQGVLQVGELRIDPVAREVTLDGRDIELSAKEFALLRKLAEEPTRVFTKEELLRDVWGFKLMGSTRTLDSHASRLRRKLTDSGRRWIVNVWGIGYRLTDRVT
jgi:DNA-binding response OmpR family regulator